jgi:hypothetical protein
MKRRIAASLTTLLWAFFIYMGYDLTKGVALRHIPGYPSAGQMHYYVHFPLLMMFVSIGLLLLAKKLPETVFVVVWLLQIAVFIPFFLGYTGGM